MANALTLAGSTPPDWVLQQMGMSSWDPSRYKWDPNSFTLTDFSSGGTLNFDPNQYGDPSLGTNVVQNGVTTNYAPGMTPIFQNGDVSAMPTADAYQWYKNQSSRNLNRFGLAALGLVGGGALAGALGGAGGATSAVGDVGSEGYGISPGFLGSSSGGATDALAAEAGVAPGTAITGPVAAASNVADFGVGPGVAAGGGTMSSFLDNYLPSIIKGGLSLFGANQASNDASKATQAQLDATKMGLDYARETRDLAIKLNQPYYDAATGALTKLQQMAGITPASGPNSVTNQPGYMPGPNQTPPNNGESLISPYNPSNDILQYDPGYNFRLSESMRALQNSAAAKGGLLSGGFGREALRYASDYASNEYQNIYNRVSNIAGLGQIATNAATNSVNNYGSNAINLATNSGNASASGYRAQANISANLLNQLSDAAGSIDWSNIGHG